VNADLYIHDTAAATSGITAGSDLLFIVKMRSIKTTEQFAKEIEEKRKKAKTNN
jgi:hypothetical protein